MTEFGPLERAMHGMLRSSESALIERCGSLEHMQPFTEGAYTFLFCFKRNKIVANRRSSDAKMMLASAAVLLSRTALSEWMDCIVCGNKIDGETIFAAVSAEGCLTTDYYRDYPSDVALVVAHCAACRDEAHWALLVLLSAYFVPTQEMAVPRLTTHVSHEALCAAMGVFLFGAVRGHPYTKVHHTAHHLIDHAALPAPQRRCAARECGAFFVQGSCYNVLSFDTMLVEPRLVTTTTWLSCVGNDTCRQSVKRDVEVLMIAMLVGQEFSFGELTNLGGRAFKVPFQRGVCAQCAKPDDMLCAGCQRVNYCSEGCQRVDWPSHKAVCKRLRQISKNKINAPEPCADRPS